MKCPTTSTALAADRTSKLSDTLQQVWHPIESKYEGKHKIFGRNVVLIRDPIAGCIHRCGPRTPSSIQTLIFRLAINQTNTNNSISDSRHPYNFSLLILWRWPQFGIQPTIIFWYFIIFVGWNKQLLGTCNVSQVQKEIIHTTQIGHDPYNIILFEVCGGVIQTNVHYRASNIRIGHSFCGNTSPIP